MTHRMWNRRIELNILRNCARATPEDTDVGINWYSRALCQAKVIASRYPGVTTVEVVGVISALSPGSTWGRNVLDAEALIDAHAHDQLIPLVGVYGRRNVDKALRILHHEWPLNVLGGPKVRAFFYNILFPQGDMLVTIDRHMKAIAYNTPATRSGYASSNDLSAVKKSEYEYLAWHYRTIAARYGLIPSQFQAINWLVWKRVNENRDNIPESETIQ